MKNKRMIIFFSLFLSLVLIGHFAITFIYLSPTNSFRSKHWSKITAYMSPYFSQNWYLFAPNPVNQHQNLQIRLKYQDNEGKIVQTKWKDLTKPMIDKLQLNRFTSDQRVYSFQSSSLHTYVYKDGKSEQKAEDQLRLFVDYYLKTQPNPEGKITSYQMRVVTNKFPRFDQRHLPDSKGKLYYKYSDWFSYSR